MAQVYTGSESDVDEMDEPQWHELLEADVSFREASMAQVGNPNTCPLEKREYWPLTIEVLVLKQSTYRKVVGRNIL